MKNYILFTTNDSRAIDNVSMTIETDMDSRKAISLLLKNCKYDSVTITPIGKPLDRAIDLASAIGEVLNIRLHRNKRVVDTKKLDIVISSDGIPGVFVSTDCSKIILTLDTSFDNTPATLVKEHQKISQLLEMFGSKHLAYHRSRGVLELVPSDTEDIGIDWALVKGDIVKITKSYNCIEEEL